MGKNSVIKSLGKRIGNVVLHKLLVKYTNRPESIHHLQNEHDTYRDQAIIASKKYNWNEEDKKELKIRAMNFIKNKRDLKYDDLAFVPNEIERFVDEEILNMKL